MKRMELPVLLTLLSFLFFTGLVSSNKRFVCYFTNWATYRSGDGKFTVSHIDANLCTHLVFAFSKVVSTTLQPYDRSDNRLPGGTWQQFNNLKRKNPKLKTLLAVGGWNHGPGPFTQMVATRTGRDIFIRNAIDLLRRYEFDGFDLDWEYPGKRVASDKAKLSLLLRELREKVNEESHRTQRPPLLLTAAVAAGISTAEKGYDVPVLMETLDFISIMTFDYHGAWEKATGHQCPLRGPPGDELTVISSLNWYMSRGGKREKIVVALPMYARSWTLANPRDSSVGAKALSAGRMGRWTKEAGSLSNYEVCDMQNAGMRSTYDRSVGSVYGVLGKQWVTYENEATITEKVDYVINEGYSGIMVWALDHDDFTGKHCGRGKNPLLNTIARRLAKTPMPSTLLPTTTTTPSTTPTIPTTTTSTTTTTSSSTSTSTSTSTTTSPTTTTQKKTTTSEKTPQPIPNKPFECPGPYGMFPHPTMCNKYYNCFGRIHFEESCQSPRNFNPKFKQCDLNYKCS